jgi:hypothetical protein
MEVLGIKKGSFVDKATGGTVTYCHLHVADKDKNVDGLAVEVLKVPQVLLEEANKVKVKDNISVTYNKFGRVESISRF